MIKYGEPPYLECSTLGDKRFSAFVARIKKRGWKTIEQIYQAAKIFEDHSTGLSIKEAKGRKAVNQEEVSRLYSILWDEYIEANPHLLLILKNTSGISDKFGQEGHCCQATELWRIRNKSYNINGCALMIARRKPKEGETSALAQTVMFEPSIICKGVGALYIPRGTKLTVKKITDDKYTVRLNGTPFMMILKEKYVRDIEVE